MPKVIHNAIVRFFDQHLTKVAATLQIWFKGI